MARTFDLKKVMAPVGDIVRKLNARRASLLEEVAMLDRELERLGGGGRRRGRPSAAEAGTGAATSSEPRRKRRRRKREDLESMAQDIVKFIGSRGKEGATAKEIKSQFGNLLPSVNAWLKNYSKAKVRTTGAKATMRYFV
jgi:hypothetical protein